ncbi:hypothetical protein [Commensalibacter oyaizuii]|uniref:Uncharacterized protein n=1 Tax=Commensalibacter oyaizuii TaxID=3043873 RepID=A0ABT6Q2I5_9PROT|nr:hypothetical protein [Commensalibacter sp. TBRC 16381]MDI2091342.1 hypothetical protein [Commensalibacter sp. TBRC 16381]
MKKYLLIIGISLVWSIPLYASPETGIFIGKNDIHTLGYLKIEQAPFNRLYTTIDLKNIRCGAHLKGYTEQQGKRFVLHTDILDPSADDAHQCAVTFTNDKNVITIIREENCQNWHGIGCSFTTLKFYKR